MSLYPFMAKETGSLDSSPTLALLLTFPVLQFVYESRLPKSHVSSMPDLTQGY